MDEELQAIDELIARALGWFPCPNGWGHKDPMRLLIQAPRYFTDPALLPEMKDFCHERRWPYSVNYFGGEPGIGDMVEVRIGKRGPVATFNGHTSPDVSVREGRTESRAFTRALVAMLETA